MFLFNNNTFLAYVSYGIIFLFKIDNDIKFKLSNNILFFDSNFPKKIPIIFNSVFLYIKYNYILNIIIYWKVGNNRC